MNRSFQKTLAAHAARHRLAQTWSFGQSVVLAAVSVAALVVLADRLFLLGPCQLSAWPALVLPALGALLGFYAALRIPPARVGYHVDRHAGLKNLVATGVDCAGQADDVSRAVLERATAALREHPPGTVFALRANACGRWLALPVAVLILAWFMPPLDLAHRKQRLDAAAAEAASVRDGALRLAASVSALAACTNAAPAALEAGLQRDLQALAEQLPANPKGEALVKLAEFEARYRQDFISQRDFEQAARNLTTRPDLEAVPAPSRNAVEQLASSLQQGHFAKAADALRDLARQMTGSALSADQKKALAGELAKLAQALQENKAWGELAEALRKLESASASAGDAARACRNASDKLAQAAGQCQAAQELKALQEGLSEAKKAMLGDSFKDFNAEAVGKAMAKEAAALGVAGDCEGQCQVPGQGSGSGNGTGGRGRGRGGQPPENATDTAFQSRFSAGKLRQGAVLQELFVAGAPAKGEALDDYREVVESARRQAASSLAQERVPQEYEHMVKTYFESLDKGAARASQP